MEPNHIDHKTARSICDEVGDRLQQNLSLEASPLPPYLERLVDELRKRERWANRWRRKLAGALTSAAV